MIFEVKINEKLLKVQLVTKKHIKHCYLKILDKQTLQIKANIYFTIDDAKNLIEKKKNWILKAIQQQEVKVSNALAKDEFLYLGEIKKFSDYDIKDLDKFYKKQIELYIPPLVEHYSKKMQLFPNAIKYRKNKRTWGSCNYKDELNFNYLLMKYPLYVMEYIVIHELAHIKHKNHSKDFWSLVRNFCPDYKLREKNFKEML